MFEGHQIPYIRTMIFPDYNTLPVNLTESIPAGKGLVIFDGYCKLCSNSVRFLLFIDRNKKLLFSAGNGLQIFDDGETGTIMYYSKGTIFNRSDAVVALLKDIGGVWKIMGAMINIIPPNLRDKIYGWVARHRFRWFGKRNSCFFPGTEHMQRFI